MQVKKQFEEVFAFLQANQNKKVSTIFADVVALMQSKNAGGSDIGKTFLKDTDGNTVAVYCYYHKKWEPVADVEYGKKASTATGLNTMCKEGVSSWSKQQRTYKKEQSELLMLVAKGELSPEDLPNKMAELEEKKNAVEVRSDEIGFNTVEELNAYLNIEQSSEIVEE